MYRPFVDKVVIVTGGAGGIGRTTARRFAEDGAKVCVADRNLEGAEQTAAAIRAAGFEAFACGVDISKEEDNERMVAETIARFGGLDIAFLNAAYLSPLAHFFESTLEEFDRTIAVNLRGYYLGLKSVGKAIRKGGAIVVTSSAAGTTGWPDNPAYSASKHGVIGLVRSTAHAFAERGIRINAICPGMVNTAMSPTALRGGIVDSAVNLGGTVPADELTMPPFRGLGSTQHVAEFVLYLASNRAAFLTGGVHLIDGGMLSSFSA
jgi:NAD(P)-dependent dehydrogenase (short-subunit alcohol dehydrogenase family)